MLNAKSVNPLPGYITLKLQEAETKTTSGLILPDSSQEKPQIGKVLAIGDSLFVDNHVVSCPVKKGDLVVFKKYSGNMVRVNNEEVQLVEFKDLMGIMV